MAATHIGRFADALLRQRQGLTARAVTFSVNPRQRRGHAHDADAPRSVAADTLWHQHRAYGASETRYFQ